MLIDAIAALRGVKSSLRRTASGKWSLKSTFCSSAGLAFCSRGRAIKHSDRHSAYPCAGAPGQACAYVCAAGYTARGEHVCHADGGFRGGACEPDPCAAGFIANSNRSGFFPFNGSRAARPEQNPRPALCGAHS